MHIFTCVRGGVQTCMSCQPVERSKNSGTLNGAKKEKARNQQR
jgi:hypothetical protein